MKKLITSLVFAGLLLSPVLSRADGGVNGGGGGTTVPDHVSEKDIFNIVQRGKKELRLYVMYAASWATRSQNPLYKKLFGGPRTLWDVLETTDIDVRMDRPCFTSDSREVDGSIYGDPAGSICISAFRIAPKLIEERARIETLALILHELTHILGSTEEEAVDFQKQALFDMRLSADDIAEKFVAQSQLSADTLETGLALLETGLRKDVGISLADLFREVNLDFQKMDTYARQAHLLAFSKQDFDLLRLQGVKLMLAHWWNLGQSEAPDYPFWTQEYENIFQNQEEVTVAQITERSKNTYLDGNAFPGAKVKRIHTKEEAVELAHELKAYAGLLHSYFFQMKWDHPLPAFPNPENGQSANPWARFAGSYRVAGQHCEKDGFQSVGFWDQMKTIRIYSEAEGRTYFQFATENATGTDGINDNDQDLHGGLIRVNGQENTATRTSEFRGRWNDHWMFSSWTITKDADGQFAMDVSELDRTWDSRGKKTATISCHLDLVKAN